MCELADIDSTAFLAANDPSVHWTMQDLLPGAFYPGFVSGRRAKSAPVAIEDKGRPSLDTVEAAEDGSETATAAETNLFGTAVYASLDFGPSSGRLEPPPPPGLDPLLLAAAARACMNSHSPYSGIGAGVALGLAGGDFVTGSSLENVAFNPSLPPLQVALIALIAKVGSTSAVFTPTAAQSDERFEVQTVILVEEAETVASWEPRTALLLKQVLPTAKFYSFSFTHSAPSSASL
eukprot:SAG31_NODE_8229_length_1493_cov_1.564562_1_plen_235_part_00